MFLLSRPPILRWVAATALVTVALWADLRPTSTADHAFASTDIAPGDTITAADVEMLPIPPGLLVAVELPSVATRPIAAGEPILQTSVSAVEVDAPEGWLLVELAVPQGARPGSEVVAIVSGADDSQPASHRGVVVSVGIDDGFGGELAGCAFPAEEAALVAVAAAENRISVLIGR